MKQYSKSQLGLLKKLLEDDMPLTTCNKEDVDVLFANGLVKTGYVDIGSERILHVYITERGKTYLSTKAVDDNRYHLSILLSLVAIALSLIALLTSLF